MKLLQINTTVNSGSHGRIAEDIGLIALGAGHKSYIAASYVNALSHSEVIKIGNTFDRQFHGFKTRFFDRHGFGSTFSTKLLVKKIERIKPDIIHLHNIHGYYLNVKVLFEYLKKENVPVVWTFHDCWPFTGHCSYFDRVNCLKWQTECHHCPNKNVYPASWLLDNSRKNFRQKKELFTGLRKMMLVAPCRWMEGNLRNSFLAVYEIRVIYNGIDINIFRPVDSEAVRKKYDLNNKYVLGIASIWTKRKGLQDFFKLRRLLDKDIDIVLAGLNRRQCKSLPYGIKGIMRTENTDELAALYSGAEVFVNPTYVDNFPTVNLEALACGTPVITYNTGGSPEAIDEKTGRVVEKGNIEKLAEEINSILIYGKQNYTANCRKRAVDNFDKNSLFQKYISLYNDLLSNVI